MKSIEKYFFISCILILAVAVLTGCFAFPIEDPVTPLPIAPVQDARPLRTATVARGDVVRSISPLAFYVSAREERVSFGANGFRILNIYVTAGDYVQEGDVIATLYKPRVQGDLRAALRLEEWLRLDLSHLNTRHSHALSEARRTGIPFDDVLFGLERTRLEGELALLLAEIEYLNYENEQRYLRSPMDGNIVQVMTFTEGMLSSAATVAVIVDASYSVFEVRSYEATTHMEVGDFFTLNVLGVPYNTVVVDPEELGIHRGTARGHEAYLMFVDEAPIFITPPSATLTIVLEVAHDVLYIPVRAVNNAAERTFVFVLNELGVRSIRDVEIGLIGGAYAQIISGLREGELVVNE